MDPQMVQDVTSRESPALGHCCYITDMLGDGAVRSDLRKHRATRRVRGQCRSVNCDCCYTEHNVTAFFCACWVDPDYSEESRGLCRGCWDRALKAIEAGKTTLESSVLRPRIEDPFAPEVQKRERTSHSLL